MIEKVLYDFLTEQMEVPVVMELPEVPSADYPTWPDRLIVIERVGGGSVNHIESASFAIQSYGPSLYEAALLDEQVRSAMEGFPSLDLIGSARLASNYNHTDTSTKRYRYQAVYDIYYHE